MTISRIAAKFAWVLAAFAVAPPVPGDAPCDKGFRDTTAAERARMTAVLETAKGALPPPPAGWIIVNDGDISVPATLCRDVELVPLSYGFSRLYRQVGDADARQKLIEDQAAREAALYEQKKPRLEATQAKIEKLIAAQVALIEKGDTAGAQKLNPEMEKLRVEYQKIADEGYDEAAYSALAKQSNRDLEMDIAVRVNSFRVSLPPEAEPLTPLQGAQSAFRWHTETESASNDHARYLFGAWMPLAQGSWRTGERAGLALSGAHTVTVDVIADPERLTQTLDTINFAKISAAMQ